ncbi:MAG: AAA family ATPase [Cyanobacteriota bacterium]|nr:AAA family ATPase [Cyanobacteriota bacterium]
MIAELEALLDCYRAVNLSLPVVERSRVLTRVALELGSRLGVPVYLWNLGLSGWCEALWDSEPQRLRIETRPRLERPPTHEPLTAAAAALSVLEGDAFKCGLFVVEDLPSLLATGGPLSQSVRSTLVNLVYRFVSESGRFLLLLDTNEAQLPVSLSGIVPTFRLPLPAQAVLEEAIASELAALGFGRCELRELSRVALGLGSEEVRLGIRVTLARRQHGLGAELSWPALLLDYKVERFRAMGLHFLPRPEVPAFGGMDRLKAAIERVRVDFGLEARKYQIPLPKGWLLVGPPGTGKSLAVKVTAAELGFPLILAEIGAVLSGGAAYLEGLLRRVEATAPVVLWLDEFDKFFTGKTPSGAEQGHSAQILGVLLNWLQEKRSPVFVMAALNRLSVLPPELTRSGRFDKIFYVDFPQAIERKEIFELHLSRYDRRYAEEKSPLTEKEWHRLLNATVKCSGAEIFEIVKNAALAQYHAADENKNGFVYRLSLEELLQERELITPLYARDTDRIIAMENQAKFVAEPVSSPDRSAFAPVEQTLWGERI